LRYSSWRKQINNPGNRLQTIDPDLCFAAAKKNLGCEIRPAIRPNKSIFDNMTSPAEFIRQDSLIARQPAFYMGGMPGKRGVNLANPQPFAVSNQY